MSQQFQLTKDAVKVFRASAFITLGVFWLILMATYFFTPTFSSKRFVYILITTALLALSLFLTYFPSLRYKKYSLFVADEKLVFTKGVFFFEEVTIPFHRIQYITLKQGPILRKYHLATLTFVTAGGNQDIPALEYVLAQELKERLSLEVERGLRDGDESNLTPE